MIRTKIVSFTARGAETAARLADCLSGELVERYARGTDRSLDGTRLSRFAQQAMVDCDCIIFVGACGIAVRAVAPYLAGKAYDPAVLVVDEGGTVVISLLSGHLGGANALTRRLAAALGAQPVITTATDGRGLFAADDWARENGCLVADTREIRYVSAALLAGEPVGLHTDFPVEGALPEGLTRTDTPASGIVIGWNTAERPFAHTLHLIPPVVAIGIGCRRGTDEDTIARAVDRVLETAGVDARAVAGAATIDRKADEPGLCSLCARRGWTLTAFPAEQLAALDGAFTPSEFVRQTVGVDNVCERAAVCGADGGALLLRKTAADGVTVALAARHWRIKF